MWQPYFTGVGWDPFMDGAWGYYPGYGYMFASAYPWGWMPYRYGNWMMVPGMGWMWQPGGWNTWVGVAALYKYGRSPRVPARPPPPAGTVKTVFVGRAASDSPPLHAAIPGQPERWTAGLGDTARFDQPSQPSELGSGEARIRPSPCRHRSSERSLSPLCRWTGHRGASSASSARVDVGRAAQLGASRARHRYQWRRRSSPPLDFCSRSPSARNSPFAYPSGPEGRGRFALV